MVVIAYEMGLVLGFLLGFFSFPLIVVPLIIWLSKIDEASPGPRGVEPAAAGNQQRPGT